MGQIKASVLQMLPDAETMQTTFSESSYSTTCEFKGHSDHNNFVPYC